MNRMIPSASWCFLFAQWNTVVLVTAFAPDQHLLSRVFTPTPTPTPTLPFSSCTTTSLFMTAKRRQRKTPLKYLRIKPKRSRNNKERVFELQTAVATMYKKQNEEERQEDGRGCSCSETEVDLHAQLHFGDEPYFQFYNHDSFQEKYNSVFYELIVSQDLLHRDGNNNGQRKLLPLRNNKVGGSNAGGNAGEKVDQHNANPVSPPPSDEATAASYGLSCQLNVIDYTKDKWIHCDVTREEYLSFLSLV